MKMLREEAECAEFTAGGTELTKYRRDATLRALYSQRNSGNFAAVNFAPLLPLLHLSRCSPENYA
jgi:hypothetical protein